MDTTITSHHKNVSTLIHLSTFLKWFFPFGNFIAPLVLWSAQRSKSTFIDENGRNAINFQLSIFLYLLTLVILSVPFLVYFGIQLDGHEARVIFDNHIHASGDLASINSFMIIAVIVGTLALGIALFEVVFVVTAAVSASKGEPTKYPLTINFIKASLQGTQNKEEEEEEEEETNQENVSFDEA